MGVALAAGLFLGKRTLVARLSQNTFCKMFSTLWLHAWGFDWLYDRLFVKPYLLLTRILAADPLDKTIERIAGISLFFHRMLGRSVTGHLRWYVTSLGLGAILVLGFLLMV